MYLDATNTYCLSYFFLHICANLWLKILNTLYSKFDILKISNGPARLKIKS